ncbi:MAG: insulinase family protein, partial [Ferruginibacter sp.]
MKKTKFILLLSLIFLGLQSVSAQYKLPGYQKFKLNNGLTVYLMEKHEVPIISVSAIMPAGAIYDENKGGLASLTATSLMNGSTNYTKEKLDEELDFMAASIETYSSKEFAGLKAKFAAKDQSKVLNIIKDILLNPTFNVAEFEKEKARVLINLEQKKESPRN